MVKLLNKEIIFLMRANADVWWLVNDEEFKRPAEYTCITPSIHASCRCCGAPLDIGVEVYAAQLLAMTPRTIMDKTGKRRTIRNASWCYIHKENCLNPGFIQTFGFRGKKPTQVRIADGRDSFIEATLDISRMQMIDMPISLDNDDSFAYVQVPVKRFLPRENSVAFA